MQKKKKKKSCNYNQSNTYTSHEEPGVLEEVLQLANN